MEADKPCTTFGEVMKKEMDARPTVTAAQRKLLESSATIWTSSRGTAASGWTP
jgi:hypothetical protein